MRRSRNRFVAAVGLAVLAAVPLPRALGAAAPTPPTTVAPPPPDVTEKDFNVKNFSATSTTITNKFQPLVPGMAYTLTGTATRGTAGEHEVIFTVTNVTKVINGVNAVAVWDRDFQNGELVEEELAFMAQDNLGNVWSLGEYPEEHNNGKVSAPSVWLAGKQQAIAGLLVRANPQPNTPSFLQGKVPSIGFLDQASVSAVDQSVCVPIGCFTGVAVVDEFNPLDQPDDGHQFKYHIPGIGVGQIVGKGGIEQETLALIEIRALDATELAAATTRALQLDVNAYTLAKAVYTGSAPAVVRPPV